MRVAALRTDISKIYLADVENRAQRCFSSEPQGQSRYFERPTLTQLLGVLNTYAFLTLYGSNNAATVNTALGNNIFKVKTAASAAFTTITVTSGAAVPKATLVTDLNTAFTANGLPLLARLDGNHLVVDSTGSNVGVSAYIGVDVDLNSTLNPIVGFTAGALSGISVLTLSSTVYPAPNTIDVSSASILALSTFTYLTTAAQDALVGAVADTVAPSIVETGPALLSFVYGNLSKYRSSSFRPGGERVGLVAGPAVAVVDDDGVTPFSV